MLAVLSRGSLELSQAAGNLAGKRVASRRDGGKKQFRPDRAEFTSRCDRELDRSLAGILATFHRVQYGQYALEPCSGQGSCQLVIVQGHRRPKGGQSENLSGPEALDVHIDQASPACSQSGDRAYEVSDFPIRE